jgi:cytochrome P450
MFLFHFFASRTTTSSKGILTNLRYSIAGTHTTSATATLLFYHLLHNTNLMNQCVTEIDEKLPSLQPNQSAYSVTDAEASLPFLRNCIKENFRITPVFTMPLARRVLNAEGVIIAGNHIPCRVSPTPKGPLLMSETNLGSKQPDLCRSL